MLSNTTIRLKSLAKAFDSGHSIHVIFLIFSLALLTSCHSDNIIDRQPNIILIMADDLGYEGIGCFGNPHIKTPYLDQLASVALKFTDFHSNGSVCTPTRAALMTGRYQQRVGLEGVIYARGQTREVGLDTTELTIADVFKENGYATGIIGKWHLGYEIEYNPTNYGFDEFYGYISGNVDFHSHHDNTGIFDWWHNQDTLVETGYVTDLITEHSIDFIQEHKDQPFFLYVPHQSPHVPFQGRQDTAYRFPNREFSYYGPVQDRDRAYTEMVEVMDEGIGKLVATIKNEGLLEHTIFIFISDNGAEAFGHNGKLNGDKSSLLEGGHRVPALISWQGKIRAGTTHATCASFDLFPTLASLAGIDVPTQLDGLDLSQLLLNRESLDDRYLFWRYRKQSAARYGQFKLYLSDQDTFLYDLNHDLSETTDVSGQHPVQKKELFKALNAWLSDIGTVNQKTI